MTRLYFDFETWSSVNIRRGTDVYLNNAKPLLLTYAFDEGPVQVFDFTDVGPGEPSFYRPKPDMFYDGVFRPNVELWAHNVFFDRMVLRKCLGLDILIERFVCTQAMALVHGLPGGLAPLGRVLGLSEDQAKIADGMRLIRKFCGPKPLVKDHDWDKFIEYAINDITAMRECVKRMPNWNFKGDESRLWQLDQIINNRGFQIDEKFAQSAVKTLSASKRSLADDTIKATSGAVHAATQRDKLLTYICEQQGYFLPDLKAATIAAALEDETLDPAVKAILQIRLQSSKSSTSKYVRLLDSMGKDGRLRGTLQYSGAGRTARWAGRIFQPQNLPRPTMDAADIRLCIDLIREGKSDLVPLFAPINEACANGLRGLIVAPTGYKLLVADYSSIEGRGNAWLAAEQWKIKAYKENKDIYVLGYAKAFNIEPSDVSKKQRQMGKVMELALGYGGGVGAFVSMAAGYNMDLDELGRIVEPNPKAADTWEWALKKDQTYGLSKEIYVACDTLKIGYRKANPEIAAFWYMLEDAARKVINSGIPDYKVQVGPIMFDCNASWMRVRLPSGRYLCYVLPKIHNDGTISYMAWQNKQWRRVKTYGGKICENIVQAVSRDLLGHAIIQLEDHGYPIVLHIHDEVISQVAQNGQQTLKEFIALMCMKPTWAAGFPINAEGFEGTRYEKH